MTEKGTGGISLNSTIFKYGEVDFNFYTGNSDVIAGQSVDVYSGDVNADGYSDLVAATKVAGSNNIDYHTEFKVYKRSSLPYGAFQLSATQPLPTSYTVVKKSNIPNGYNFLTNDFTGDGADDVATVKTSVSGSNRYLNHIRVYKSNGTGTNFATYDEIAAPPNHTRLHSSGKFVYAGDFNGDGVGDIITLLGWTSSGSPYAAHLYQGGISTYLGTIGHSGTYNFNLNMWPTVDEIHTLDYDGDGKTDLMLIKDGMCEIFTFDGFYAKQIYLAGFPTKWHLLFFGDFNGDRKTDILARNSKTDNNASWVKAISPGTGNEFISVPHVFDKTPSIDASYTGDKLVISDYNGDGKMDIFHGWRNNTVVPHDTKLDVYYSKGDAFFKEQYSHSEYLIFAPQTTFDLNGDGRTDLINAPNSNTAFQILYFKGEGKELLLEKVKNGEGLITEWVHRRMTDPGTNGSFYKQGPLTAQPLNNIQFPFYLVSDFKVQNGIGGYTTVQYNYEEAKLHKHGKGLLGMKLMTANNLASGFKTVTENEFNTTFYVAALKNVKTSLTSNNSLINEKTITNEFVNLGSKKYWLRVNTSNDYRLLEGVTITSNNTFDANGNITQNTTYTGSQQTTVTNAVYGQYGTPIPAKVTSSTVTNTRTGQPAYSVTNTFAYNALGQLTSKVDFSGQSQSVTTAYTYNTLGNQTGMTVSATGVSNRTSTFAYDAKGRFAISSTNPVAQVSSATFDVKWGQPLTTTGIDGLVTTFAYDDFGRPTTTGMPSGYTISEFYGWDIEASEGKSHYHLISHPGKPDIKVWYDILGRETNQQTEGFQGQWIYEQTTFDAKGNMETSVAPFKSGESLLTTTYTYDVYNRAIGASNTLGTTTNSYSYSSGNLTTTTTNPANQVSSKVTDATGKMTSATDYGGTLTYTYNSQGNLLQVKQGTTILVTNEYDIYGRQTKLIDIDAGTTQYAYNALGEMTSQTNANGQTHTMTYDLLGRNTQRVGPEGTTTYEYFPTGTAAVNQIKKIIGFAGNLEEFTYDSYGRLATHKETVDAVSHTTSYTYNTYGDVTNTTYPSSFAVNVAYDANGYLNTLKNGTNSVTMFTNTGMNGFNQYKTYTAGNGKSTTNTYYFGIPTRYQTLGVQDLNLTWDYSTGNLTSRNDAIKGKTETFAYDNLNRLTSATVTGQSAMTVSFASNGNISTKTDAGTYSYGISKIHAATEVTNPSGVVPSLYQYVTYTPFFQPNVITEGTNELTFTYGADYERVKTVQKLSGTTTSTKYFFDSYEKEISSGQTTHIHYISVGGLRVIVTKVNSGSDVYHYAYTDHLGSILTVTTNTGVIEAEQNFDAWGRKRSPSTWTYTSIPSVPYWLYRGYTGHEHLPTFGLVNMNGRLYDPVLGRMLSTDNYTHGGTQGMNRYSYVYNNPLRFTDPDGENPAILVGAVIGGFVNLGVGLYSGEVRDGMDFLVYFGTGAAIGALAGATAGASLAATGLSASSVAGGAFAGAVGGAVGGGLQGATNAAYQTIKYNAPSENIGESFIKGMVYGAIGGAVIGGIVGGYAASRNGANIWTGKPKPKIGFELGDYTYTWPDGKTVSSTGQVVNKNGASYPKVYVEGYGEVPFPDGPFTPNNSQVLRSQFTPKYKASFKEWWIQQGRPWPNVPEGSTLNIHHIKPLAHGGTNAFDNLVPMIQPQQHQPFTSWWRGF